MKPSTSMGKLSSSTSNSKNKKSSKDREKRKSQSIPEINNQHNSDKGSPTKDSTRKFAGYGTDQLTNMSEQSIFEHITDEVGTSFVEDLNYKLRYVIYDALIKARLSGRNCITSADVDDTFECLQIDKVYGAPAVPNWITCNEQNVYYLDDTKVNLIELAEELNQFTQPRDPVLSRNLLPESKEIGKSLRNYFAIMCQAVVRKEDEVRLTALNDISKNNLVGPIIEWFYHFGYFLLSKDITYDSLTTRALDLIVALESNPISSLIVSDKQIMLLTRLLLQRLLRSISSLEMLKQTCRVLSILCKRIIPRKFILKKVIIKFPEIKDDFAVSVICLANELGLDAIYTIIIPHLQSLLRIAEEQRESEFIHELLRCYSILCKKNKNFPPICDEFYDAFNDGILPFWKPRKISVTESTKIDYNWINVRKQLLKTRRFVNAAEKKNVGQFDFGRMFPEQDEDYFEVKKEPTNDNYASMQELTETNLENAATKSTLTSISKANISFKIQKFTRLISRKQLLNSNRNINSGSMSRVEIGKRTLLVPVLNSCKSSINLSMPCADHSILCYNL